MQLWDSKKEVSLSISDLEHVVNLKLLDSEDEKMSRVQVPNTSTYHVSGEFSESKGKQSEIRYNFLEKLYDYNYRLQRLKELKQEKEDLANTFTRNYSEFWSNIYNINNPNAFELADLQLPKITPNNTVGLASLQATNNDNWEAKFIKTCDDVLDFSLWDSTVITEINDLKNIVKNNSSNGTLIIDSANRSKYFGKLNNILETISKDKNGFILYQLTDTKEL